MNDIIIIIGLAAMLIAGCVAVMVRSTLKSAVALAIVSVALGIVMYELGSIWAALFEISVCSGFVTVIFISAITMTNEGKDDQDKIYEQKKHTMLLPLLLILAGVGLIVLLVATGFELPGRLGAVSVSFQEVLWNEHRGLLWAQIIALLAGAFAVIVLFREEKKK